MAVLSNTFGGLHLSGTDAKKFRDQVKFGRANDAAKASALKGRSLAKSLAENGQVKVAKPTS